MEKDTRPLFQITEAAHACGEVPADDEAACPDRYMTSPAATQSLPPFLQI